VIRPSNVVKINAILRENIAFCGFKTSSFQNIFNLTKPQYESKYTIIGIFFPTYETKYTIMGSLFQKQGKNNCQ